MFSVRIVRLWFVGMAFAWMGAHAEEPPPAAVLEAVKRTLPSVEPDYVVATPVPGLYEVGYGPTIVYFSADGQYLIRGEVIDLASRRNLTKAKVEQARRRALASMDEADMIVFGPEDAAYTVTVFTDVDCPYCAKLHREMAEYNRRGIRVRYLAFPRAGPESATYDRMVSVWCAEDRHKAIGDAKLGRPVPTATCPNPVREHFRLGHVVGVTGTPTIVLESGEVLPGYVPPRELEKILKRAEPS